MDLTLPTSDKVAGSSNAHTTDHNLIINAINAISSALGADPAGASNVTTRLSTIEVGSPTVLALQSTDDVPGGTAVGTIIVRY